MSQKQHSILVIDDDQHIRRLLRVGLELENFHFQEATNVLDGMRMITSNEPDLVILDLALPDLDGDELLRRLRAWSPLPVIVLSARGNECEKVRLFDQGATDYVVKPFGMSELVARIRSILHRDQLTLSSRANLFCGDIMIDRVDRCAFLSGVKIPMPPKEFYLLQILVEHGGRVVPHRRLLQEVWGHNHAKDGHYLRIFVRKIREKIEADPARPRRLITELGVGYRLLD